MLVIARYYCALRLAFRKTIAQLGGVYFFHFTKKLRSLKLRINIVEREGLEPTTIWASTRHSTN